MLGCKVNLLTECDCCHTVIEENEIILCESCLKKLRGYESDFNYLFHNYEQGDMVDTFICDGCDRHFGGML